MHLPGLINDLALILMTAGGVTLLFRKLRQPVVLGYLLAGFLVSHLATVVDPPNIQVWSEIGIIFLLFALGLEFSFKKLMKVGGSAVVTSAFEVAAMVGIGWLTGLALGWSQMDSIFLGGVLAISSTTIIIRAFEEVGVKGQGFVNLVFGALIVEDMIAILLLVVLGTLAASETFAGLELLYAAGKLVFFLTIWFLSGIFLVPTLLRRAKPWMNHETLLVMSVGFCFAMVVFATRVGFSPALGAFIMGSIFAETVEAEQIEHLISPVKDLFAALFFVSVGMLIEPKTITEHAGPIAIITVVTIVGKILSTSLGALISGRSLRHSVQAGFSLAQIGEFSFIIAGLGLSLKVTSPYLYPIAVSVSAITTFCTPYLIRSADPAYHKLVTLLPQKVIDALDRYAHNTGRVSATSEWSLVVRAYATGIFLFGILISAIFLLIGDGLPYLLQWAPNPMQRALLFVASLALSSPFLWGFAIRRPAALGTIWTNDRARLPLAFLELLRVLLAAILVGTLSEQVLKLSFGLTAAIGFCAILIFAFSRNLTAFYRFIERLFVANLTEREQLTSDPIPILAPWDAHIAWFDTHPDSVISGMTLQDLDIRSKFGVTIAMLERGSRRIVAPTSDTRIFPHDRLAVIGTDAQLGSFRQHIEPLLDVTTDHLVTTHYSLRQIELTGRSGLIGKSVRDSQIRERTQGLLVGIERRGERILNPDSTVIFEPGDHLWIVGEPDAIRALENQK